MKLLTSLDLLKNELLNARVQNLASDPASAVEGQIYHNTTDHKLKVFNGTAWSNVGSVVTDPVTGDGKITIDGVVYTVYTLPTASGSVLGGVKVGSGLSVTAGGVLSADNPNWANVQNKPTALSAFTNDEGFIDNTVDNLANYYKKAETYTQAEVNALVGGLALIQILAVNELPASGSSNIIYLIPKAGGSAPNAKDEYLWTGSTFEKIGDTEIDLTNYLTVSGNASNVTVAFTDTDGNMTSGSSLATLFGIISKKFSQLSAVAKYVLLTTQIAPGSLTSFIESSRAPASVVAQDATTGETVMIDSTYNSSANPAKLTVSIASEYAHAIVVNALFPISD